MAEGDADSGPEKKLIEALREFINQAQGKTSTKSTELNLLDAIWLMMALGCVVLALYLVPETWLTGEQWKFFLEKLFPWFLNLGALAAVIKSPDSVLAATRHSGFRWSIGCVLLLLMLFAAPLFRVEPEISGEGVALVDGKSGKDGRFQLRFGSHEVELRAKNNVQIPPRTLHIEPADLIRSIPHGFQFKPVWRVIYRVTVYSQNTRALEACIEPRGFEFDDDFVNDARTRFQSLDRKSAEVTFSALGSIDSYLPAGGYELSGYVEGCGLTSSHPLEVGPNSRGATLEKARCGSGPATIRPRCGGSNAQEASK